MKLRYLKSALLGGFLFGAVLSAAASSNPGSLSLDSLLQKLVANNPDVQKARQSLVQADEQIQLIQSGLRPLLNASASYARVGPVSKFDLADLGEAVLTPANNYSGSLNYQQVLYDFGRTGKSVAVEEAQKNMLNESVAELQQQLSLKFISTYYRVVYLQQALEINDDEMATLQEHEQIVQKKLDAGTSTRYELLSTQVHISKLKSQQVDLESVRIKELVVLSTLVGEDFDVQSKFPEELPQLLVGSDVEQALEFAYENRNELKIAREQEQVAGLQLEAIRSEVNPSVLAMASVGARNGYEPNIKEIRPNYTVGVGVHVPVYSASKNKHEQLLQQAKQEELRFATESAKRVVKQEVVQSVENMKAAGLKIEQSEMQLRLANEAYKLAEVSFKAGAITNLDLLDASTNLEDSKLALLKTRIDYLLATYQLKYASGEILY